MNLLWLEERKSGESVREAEDERERTHDKRKRASEGTHEDLGVSELRRGRRQGSRPTEAIESSRPRSLRLPASETPRVVIRLQLSLSLLFHTREQHTADGGESVPHARASSFERPREKGTGVQSRGGAPDEVLIARSLALPPSLSLCVSLDVPSLLLLPRAVMSDLPFPTWSTLRRQPKNSVPEGH